MQSIKERVLAWRKLGYIILASAGDWRVIFVPENQQFNIATRTRMENWTRHRSEDYIIAQGVYQGPKQGITNNGRRALNFAVALNYPVTHMLRRRILGEIKGDKLRPILDSRHVAEYIENRLKELKADIVVHDNGRVWP